MSILIKGVDMPNDCRECPFEMYYFNCGETKCRATGKILADFYKPIPFDGRAEECPLKEIPDHGMIVSKETLLECLYEIEKEEEYDLQRCNIDSETTAGEL